MPAFKGEVEVYEAFGELAVPIIKDAPWAKNISAETSLRVANYSMDNIDTVSSYKYTFGITMAPEFLPNLRVAVDYYDISISDAISEIGNEDIIKECYSSSVQWGDSNSFCNDITRDEEGNIIKILQRNFNLDELTTRGVDIAIQYRYDLGEYGSLSLKGDMTHIIETLELIRATMV